MYSSFGSFYIPSCIMVFVYIKIYYAARERARRNINKPNFSKRISRKFQNLSDKKKVGGKEDEKNRQVQGRKPPAKLSVPPKSFQINNKPMTDSSAILTTTDSNTTSFHQKVPNGGGDHCKIIRDDQPSASNSSSKEEVELHPILSTSTGNCNLNGCSNDTSIKNNNGGGLTTSVNIENSDEQEKEKKLKSSTNGSTSGCKKKMRFSDDTKGSECDIDNAECEPKNDVNSVPNLNIREHNVEADTNDPEEQKPFLPMKVVRVESKGPQPKQIHPRKKMVHIMSAFAAEEEDEDSPQGLIKLGSSNLCDRENRQKNEEDAILENPSATEIVEVQSGTAPHPYGECATARANGVRTRRSVGVSTRTDSAGGGVQSQTCSLNCRRVQRVGGNGKGKNKADVVMNCDDSNYCSICNKPRDKIVGPLNPVRALKARIRIGFRNPSSPLGSVSQNSSSSTGNSRRSSKGKFCKH